jgi:hypothetical protein
VIVGVISDTHGLLRPEAKEALAGVHHIIHAGDIGSPQVLEELGTLAPVIAVRGNNDKEPWAQSVPEVEAVELNGVLIYTLHDINDLDLDPRAAGFSVVITGHSHRPVITTRDDVLFINPGSAGPRRFNLPVSVGFLEISGGAAQGRIQVLL